jgi:peptidoglycan/xylan/chitin deacetylase (PgdA/CDA1 family)
MMGSAPLRKSDQAPPGASNVLVLCYHAVSERWDSHYSVTPERLEEQLAFLVDRGYRGATFTEAVTSPTAAKTVAVTFDDAYRSVYDRAFPILSRLGLPGTLFVPTKAIDAGGPMALPGLEKWFGGPYEDELFGMSWEQVEELDTAGWEIGSHTRSHSSLVELDSRELDIELRGSREDCEDRLGKPCFAVAYPYGFVSAQVVETARRAGYRTGAALKGSIGNWLNWPRLSMYHRSGVKRIEMNIAAVANESGE